MPPVRTWRISATVADVARDATLVEKALIDAAVDAYAGWREECAAVRRAHQRWKHGPRDERGDAFAAYTSALDREQHAADLYAGLLGYYQSVRRNRSRRERS